MIFCIVRNVMLSLTHDEGAFSLLFRMYLTFLNTYGFRVRLAVESVTAGGMLAMVTSVGQVSGEGKILVFKCSISRLAAAELSQASFVDGELGSCDRRRRPEIRRPCIHQTATNLPCTLTTSAGLVCGGVARRTAG